MAPEQLVTLAAGAFFGALGWLVVGLYIQRRQFERQARNAGRAVHFELAVNEVNVAVALDHGAFQPLGRSTFDSLLPELATWLPAEELQTVVRAYMAHAGYEQVKGDDAIPAPVRQALLERALAAQREGIAVLRARSFDQNELRRMDVAPAMASKAERRVRRRDPAATSDGGH